MKTLHKSLLALAALIVLVVALAAYQLAGSRQPDQAALLDAGIVLLPQSREVPDLTLTDQDGRPVAVDELDGQWHLVFFGYTFCPDICPTTLADLKQLQGRLPEDSRPRLRSLMVSVDPARDTPAQLKQYLDYFDAGFTGLTGAPEDILTLSNGLGIPFIPGDTSRDNYTVDHSGNLALIGPDGRQQGFIRAPLDVGKLAKTLPQLLRSEP